MKILWEKYTDQNCFVHSMCSMFVICNIRTSKRVGIAFTRKGPFFSPLKFIHYLIEFSVAKSLST